MRRENFNDLVSHKKSTPLVDLGGCPQAFLSANQEKNLCEFLGFKKMENKELLPFGQSYNIDERILKHYDIDTRGVGYIFSPSDSHYKIIDSLNYIDEWGVERHFTGMYWDIVKSPLKNASYDYVKAYPFPNPKTIRSDELLAIKNSAKFLHDNTDYIVVASHPVYGIFELGCWMFGFDDFLLKMALEPETIELFFNRVLEYQKEVNKIYYTAVGEYIDVTTSGDDFATQSSTFFSVDMFNQQVAPFFQARITDLRQYTSAKFLHHSCGSVFTLIPSLIDCGVEILNPIQPCSKIMIPQNLKSTYGRKINFHGGFDTQNLLINGTATQIKDGVFALYNTMLQNGGYIFATAHVIQDDVPVENIDALFNATIEYKTNYKTNNIC